jgi:hypothetical protein
MGPTWIEFAYMYCNIYIHTYIFQAKCLQFYLIFSGIEAYILSTFELYFKTVRQTSHIHTVHSFLEFNCI